MSDATIKNGFWRTQSGAEAAGFISPYRFFTAADWARFRADTPLTLSEDEINRLRSMNDPISLDEVERIYLAVSRLLYSHVEAALHLYEQRRDFLQFDGFKTPFIIGVAGPVAVGKSTTARVLKELLARWPSSPKVDLVTTDGFLKPNRQLNEEGIMHRKGFPESYDVAEVLRFLSAIKAGEETVTAPSYSHFIYDVLPDSRITIDRPDILIFEGINVLQSRDMPREGESIPFVSDYFDFSIYIDADVDDIERWYINRFMQLRDTAFRDAGSYFHRYSQVSKQEALDVANGLWRDINLVNLLENIQPTRPRADLVLRKGKDHLVEKVALRKL
ncbi:MAG: type I pantothenate kinase [Pseudomonadota bacterium]